MDGSDGRALPVASPRPGARRAAAGLLRRTSLDRRAGISTQPRDLEVLTIEVERLREANTTLLRILGAIEEYVYSGEFLADDGYALRFAGPCRERFLGLTAEAAQDAVWVDFVHPDELGLFHHAHDAARLTGSLDIQYRLRGADGQVRWVRDRGRVRRVGDRTYLDGSILDVTALRRAEQRLTEHVRDIEVLAAAHREMARSADPAAARRAVCRAVRSVCGASGVGLYQPDGSELLLVETDGRPTMRQKLPGSGSAGAVHAYRSGQRSFVTEQGPGDRAGPAAPGTPTYSMLFEPVLRGGQAIGVITVVWDDRIDALPARVQALLPLLVGEAAVALERADLVARLSVAAHTDALTGLLNRRALEELLPLELERAARSASPLCLAMLDLDHFKAYNDRHGHPAGDVLLRAVSRHWQHALRASDALIRFGGEEFLAVLPGCDLLDASARMDSLRRATPSDQTCSVGVVRWDGVESVDELLGRADQAMYAAKHAGRDQVRAAS